MADNFGVPDESVVGVGTGVEVEPFSLSGFFLPLVLPDHYSIPNRCQYNDVTSR